jgi:hypothetical protein
MTSCKRNFYDRCFLVENSCFLKCLLKKKEGDCCLSRPTAKPKFYGMLWDGLTNQKADLFILIIVSTSEKSPNQNRQNVVFDNEQDHVPTTYINISSGYCNDVV